MATFSPDLLLDEEGQEQAALVQIGAFQFPVQPEGTLAGITPILATRKQQNENQQLFLDSS